MTGSSAFLPAQQIVDACRANLADIDRARGFMLQSFMKPYLCRPNFWSRVRTVPEALACVSAHEKDIVYLHRIEEEWAVKRVFALAFAVAQMGEGLSVTVSADDFRYLEKFYPKETKA